MSRIDELVAEHCPEGVEFRDLGDVIRLNFGTRITKLKDNGTIYPVYGGGGESFRTDSFNREDEFVVSRFAMSANCVRRVKGKFWMLDSGFTFDPLTPDILKDYVAYWLFNSQADIYACSSQGAQKNLKTAEFKRFRIPVPPLEVQRAIVEVLDTFSKLEAELEAELEARKQQYEHYRSNLIDPSTSAVSVALGEIAEFKYGYTTKATDSGDYRFLRITDITEAGTLNPDGAKFIDATAESKAYEVKPNDLLMARTGATYGKTLLVKPGQAAAVYASFLIRIRFKDEQMLPAFYWHFAQSNLYWAQANALVSSGGQPQFNANALKMVRVPVPPLDEQRRIVAILDKFDALVNDLSIGLPAELAARRQQYEYYRDKLLTFKELEVTA